MKSPTYILKNVYQENLQEYQYKKHISKIQNISSKQLQVGQNEQEQMDKLKYYRQQKERTRKFMEQQAQFLRQQSDNQLIKKIVQTDQRGRTSHEQYNQTKSLSLIASAKKQQLYEIGLENVRLGKRILNLPSVIKKSEFDKQYAKHTLNVQNASRMRNIKKSGISTIKSIKEIIPSFTEIPIQFRLVVFNKELQNKEQKNECLYSVEVFLEDQFLCKSIAISFDQLQILQLLVPMSEEQYQQFQQKSITLKIYKIKNNNDLFMGQIYIGYEDEMREKDIMKIVGDREIWNGFIQL